MSFALFLRGLVLVLVVFAITTYVVTGSLWTTLIQTVICAILIQVGYFAAVLFLVWRSPRAENAEAAKSDTVSARPDEQQPGGKVARLPGAPSSDHP